MLKSLTILVILVISWSAHAMEKYEIFGKGVGPFWRWTATSKIDHETETVYLQLEQQCKSRLGQPVGRNSVFIEANGQYLLQVICKYQTSQ